MVVEEDEMVPEEDEGVTDEDEGGPSFQVIGIQQIDSFERGVNQDISNVSAILTFSKT